MRDLVVTDVEKLQRRLPDFISRAVKFQSTDVAYLVVAQQQIFQSEWQWWQVPVRCRAIKQVV